MKQIHFSANTIEMPKCETHENYYYTCVQQREGAFDKKIANYSEFDTKLSIYLNQIFQAVYAKNQYRV